MADFIRAVDLARECGVSPAGIRKSLDRHGVPWVRLGAQSNSPVALTPENAELYKQRIAKPFLTRDTPMETPNAGGVYAVRVGSLDGQARLKIGWAKDFKARLAQHRCIAPDLIILRLWKGAPEWAEAALFRTAMTAATQVAPEMVQETEGLLDKLDSAAELMGLAQGEFAQGVSAEDRKT